MIKTGWEIRRAISLDAEALAGCMRDAYLDYSDRFENNTLPPLIVDYEQEIRLYPVWVAEAAEGLVGGLVLIEEHAYLTIANIAVHPQYQGNGLGRGLLAHAETEARRLGYKTLRLATHVLLTENISLYSHLGWREIGREHHRVFMEKEVSN